MNNPNYKKPPSIRSVLQQQEVHLFGFFSFPFSLFIQTSCWRAFFCSDLGEHFSWTVSSGASTSTLRKGHGNNRNHQRTPFYETRSPIIKLAMVSQGGSKPGPYWCQYTSHDNKNNCIDICPSRPIMRCHRKDKPQRGRPHYVRPRPPSPSPLSSVGFSNTSKVPGSLSPSFEPTNTPCNGPAGEGAGEGGGGHKHGS